MSVERDLLAEVCLNLAKLEQEMQNDPWNRILELVRHGKLSRDRAEEWARERKKPPFETRPPADKHDPMAAMDWTLAMATAWIIWRTPQAVRECMAAYVAECSTWVPCDYQRPSRRGPVRPYRVRGFELKTPATPMPADVLSRAPITKVLGTSFMVEPERAERELREALRKGDLVASAGRQANPIEKIRWSALSPFDRPRRGGPHDAVYDEDGDVQFSRVTVEQDAVREKWRVQTQPKTGKRPGVKPTLRASLTTRMLSDLRVGSLGREEKQEVLAKRYGASRETCVAAYRSALSELSIPTNGDTDRISTA